MSVVEAFWQHSTPYERRLFPDEAAGRAGGRTTFTFNVFDVELNFDANTATVAGLLSTDDQVTTSLSDFLARAASFGDDPSIGHCLTEMQRRPPTYEVEPGGGASQLPP